MPSFTRRAGSTQPRPAPPGTIPALSASTPPLHLLPTGIPSLDDLLGGGLPLGGILAIQAPDKHTAWSRLVERYFIAQGLVSGQKSVVVGEEGEARDVVGGCMWVEEGREGGSESEGEDAALGEGVGEGKGGMRIAWRYERMKKFQTTIKGSGRELNLMTPIPQDLLSHLEKTDVQSYIPLDTPYASTSSSSESWTIMAGALKRISDVLAKQDDKSALRLTIRDLGGIDWAFPSSSEILRFLHCIKSLVKQKPIGVLVTFPSEICRLPPPGQKDLERWTEKLGWGVDALIEIRGFGDDPTLPPLFHPLHGLLSLPVLPTSHHLLPPSFRHSSLLGLAGIAGSGGAGENNLGFRLKRKRFVVETVHLGIEGGTGERRTEPKPELGSLVGATSGTASAVQEPSEGVERVQSDQKESSTSGMAVEVRDQGVDRPKGPKDDKPKKVRARVRFGGEEELGPEVQIGGAQPEAKGHDGHERSHDHSHSQPAGRPTVRHDRPDLYEF